VQHPDVPAAWLVEGRDVRVVTVNSANPEGSSQDEINAVQQLGTQDRAPDVLDLGQSFANKNVALFAPYKVATWDAIPAGNKDANGAWVNDYGGFISIGCNAKLVATCPKTLADLASPSTRARSR
jgi:putative spermidine/putrescine transport system substrate-binding protein